MKTFKGTEGEWFIANDKYDELETKIETKEYRIAEVKHYDSKIDKKLKEPSKKQGKANAKLIASAPDLLEALQLAEDTLLEIRRIFNVGINKSVFETIEKAINKAL